MRLVITGSSGQIGTNLALRCLELGHRVTGVDCRPNGWVRLFDCRLHDLSQPQEAGAEILRDVERERPEIIVHLAAHAKVHALVSEPRRAMENITMTQHVLEWSRALRIPIIVASSREVYGEVYRTTTVESDADFRTAASPYSAGKLAVEAMTAAYGRCYGLKYLIFRLSNVYGRYDNDLNRMERVIPLFISRVGNDQPVTVFGGEKVLDFTHVDDCVDGIVAGIERLMKGQIQNETINLASGCGNSLLTMVSYVGSALGRQPRVSVAPSRTGEITRYVANIDRARTLLGFTPKVTLPEGINRAVAWGKEWSSASGTQAKASRAG
jgi:UDP-glucose 4-epimerase